MSRINSVKVINLNSFSSNDGGGSLIPITAEEECPFKISRIFYVFGVKPQIKRGGHAHRECHQMLICLNGSCEVVYDDGVHCDSIVLSQPNQGIWIPPKIWADQVYLSPSTVLLVLTDKYYSENDYIRHYRDYINFIDSPNIELT